MLASYDGAVVTVSRALSVGELLDAVRYGGAPLDEAQRRDFAVRYRNSIASLVEKGVLRAS